MGDGVQRKAEVVSGGSRVPQDVAEVLGDPLEEAAMCVAVAEVFLVLRQQRAGFSRQTEEWNQPGIVIASSALVGQLVCCW